MRKILRSQQENMCIKSTPSLLLLLLLLSNCQFSDGFAISIECNVVSASSREFNDAAQIAENLATALPFFLEKNMLSYFLHIVRQKIGGSSFVCAQLLQTLNILFENLRNETSLYYLLSNNHFKIKCYSSSVPRFLHLYATYMEVEKRRLDSTTDQTNLNDSGHFKDLAILNI
ncbi:hypothetical protein GQX74_011049 [Glossina fuscipes]|nr:hypothetical protein GQX74_011049 [Glossina fuscipes]